jgi:23S rRNA-/tRNA-specific pseudouridylate synthase
MTNGMYKVIKKMKIEILYEDSDILAIDKPSGVIVHPPIAPETVKDEKKMGEAITDWILENYPETRDVGEPMRIKNPQVKSHKVHKVKSEQNFQLSTFNFTTIPRPGIVHRLDRQTSGVLLVAKTQKAHQFLKSQFINREIKKVYLAIVSGFVKADHGTVDKPIGRSPSDPRRRLSGRGAKGTLREAVTEYKVLKRFTSPRLPIGGQASPTPPVLPLSGEEIRFPPDKGEHKGVQGEGEKFTLLEIHPKTGRTHQIRVHMKYLNHPVACDTLYSPNGSCPHGMSRMALHAKSIEFKNTNGETMKVESPIPIEFVEFAGLKDLAT